MKTITHIKKNLKLVMLVLSISIAQISFPQTGNGLVFKNSFLLSGTALQDGAKYVFPNVTTGVDAVLEIIGRSDASVVINDVDLTSTGWDKAFQPQLGIPGTAPANSNWWVDFGITFYEAGFTANNKKVQLNSINVTGLDIDGDNQSVREYSEMYEITSQAVANGSALNPTLLATLPVNPYSGKAEYNYKFQGPVTNFVDIDTSAVNVMASYLYEHKKSISFRIGAITGASTTSSAMRLNSIWFKEFSLAPITILPVKLTSFTAILNNNKVELNWKTATEENLNSFVIEKSFDGVNYIDAGMVFALGNTTSENKYSMFDNVSNVTSTVVYYRLRSVDNDGKAQFSETRMIRLLKQNQNNISILTYPNPVTNVLRITIPAAWQNKAVVYEVIGVNGQVVNKIVRTNAGQTETTDVSKIQPGIYMIRVGCDGQSATQKIVKH